jgi:HK97 family phage portal protein
VTSRYESGYPRTWTVLDAQTMKVFDAGGSRGYRSNNYPLDPRDVIQVQRNPTGALRGTPALEAYWSNVQSAYAAESFAADVYASSGVNRMALRTKQRFSQEQAEDLQAQWVAAVSRRLGAPAIIPPDIDLLETLTVSPKDLLLIESRQWDATQIAAAFGVPSVLLNIVLSGGLVYQAPPQLIDSWWRTELMPRATSLQEALSRWLPRGHWVEFDSSQATRPDLAQLTDIAIKAVTAGLLSVDEARAWVFDRAPLAQGDQATEFYEEAGAHGSVGSEPSPELASLEEALQ